MIGTGRESIVKYRAEIRLQTNEANPHINLGSALLAQREVDGLSHPDFRETLIWGSGRLGMGIPDELTDRTLSFKRRDSVIREFEDDQVEADERMRRLSADQKRFQALLEAYLIGADVVESIARKGTATTPEWIVEAFGNRPTSGQLDGIVAGRLRGRTLLECPGSGAPRAAFHVEDGAGRLRPGGLQERQDAGR